MKVMIVKTVSRIIHESNEFFDFYLVVFTDLSSFECGGFYELPIEIRQYINNNKPTSTHVELDGDDIDSPYTTFKNIYDIESEDYNETNT